MKLFGDTVIELAVAIGDVRNKYVTLLGSLMVWYDDIDKEK